jgi:outer membrane protein assembly factor BamD
VQCLAPKISQCVLQLLTRASRHCQTPAINTIPNQWLAPVSEMDANLVRATGIELYTHIGVCCESLQDSIVSDGRPALFLNTHFQTINRMPPNRRVNRSAPGKDTTANREVVTGYFPFRKRPHQRGVCFQILANQQQAAGFLVQSMHNAGPRQFSRGRHMVQQAIHQSATCVSGARVNDQSHRLVDHQQILILVDHIKLNVLRLADDANFNLWHQPHLLAAVNGVFGPHFAVVNRDKPLQDPAFQAAAGIFGKHTGQGLVQSLTGERIRNRLLLGRFSHASRKVTRKDRGRKDIGNRWNACSRAAGAGHAGVYGILADRAAFMQSAAPIRLRPAQANLRIMILTLTTSLQRLFRNAAGPANDRRMFSRKFVATVLAAVLLTGCGGNDEVYDLSADIRDAYIEAQEAVESGNYRKAIGIFEALQARFPFSQFSTQIQLELAYAYYMYDRIEQAIDAADTFLRENPTHARVDYAIYIKGLAYFERNQGRLERIFRKDINRRPPRDGELAFSLFSRLVDRYPASPYSADAQQRMVYLKNRLASYENVVARFYMDRDAYVAALNRVKIALETYHGADSGAESLQIMIEAYEGLGMTDLANDTRRVLENNFSNDPSAADETNIASESSAE